ncbi:MAG: hypothetical protein V4590_06935 [Bacteroidota bacterium]
MKTETEWNAEILGITLKIQSQFPELSKYITEMPVSIPDVQHPEITIRNLKEYYESLETLLVKYKVNHEH